jgi:hypothetical protein
MTYEAFSLEELVFFITLMFFFNTSISASQTSGTIPVMNCFDILKRYCKLVYESRVARKLSGVHLMFW